MTDDYGSSTYRRADACRCPLCGRGNALIEWGDGIRYCRWSRDDKCDLTVEVAMWMRDEMLEEAGRPRRFGTTNDAGPAAQEGAK